MTAHNKIIVAGVYLSLAILSTSCSETSQPARQTRNKVAAVKPANTATKPAGHYRGPLPLLPDQLMGLEHEPQRVRTVSRYDDDPFGDPFGFKREDELRKAKRDAEARQDEYDTDRLIQQGQIDQLQDDIARLQNKLNH